MEKEIAFVLALIQQSKMVKYDINEGMFSDANYILFTSTTTTTVEGLVSLTAVER
jgi:hypothetical protein